MEAKQDQRRQTIENVVNLDIRRATEAAKARIESIGNVVNLLYSPETAYLIEELHIGNVVNAIEASAEAWVYHGQVDLDPDTFVSATDALAMVVFGQVSVAPELRPEDLERGLAELSVCGRILCPDHLASALRAKVRYLQGPMYVYARGVRVIPASLTLDERLLNSLDDGTQLLVIGKLDASQVLPNELLERKIAKIQVADGVVCREENADILLPRLEHKGKHGRVTVIPAGFQLVERPLILSNSLLGVLPSRKLYCTELVRIEEDVAPQTLDSSLEAIVATQMVLCPASMADVMGKKLDPLETDVIFYEGTLWLVEDTSTLTTAHLEQLTGAATLVVLGAVKIAPDVTPQMLAERIAQVHNLGLIKGTPEQTATLQFRLGRNEGELLDRAPPGEKPPAEAAKEIHRVPNIVNLSL